MALHCRRSRFTSGKQRFLCEAFLTVVVNHGERPRNKTSTPRVGPLLCRALRRIATAFLRIKICATAHFRRSSSHFSLGHRLLARGYRRRRNVGRLSLNAVARSHRFSLRLSLSRPSHPTLPTMRRALVYEGLNHPGQTASCSF